MRGNSERFAMQTVAAIGGSPVYLAEQAAHRNAVVKVVLAVILAVSFWYAVPYVFPLQLDPNPLKATLDEATAYQGSLSRQLAMPVVFLVSAYGWYRLPMVGRFTKVTKMAGVSLCYVLWACVSLMWSTDVLVAGKRLLVFGIDVFFAASLAVLVPIEELALFGFLATGAVALIALFADVLVLKSFAPLDADYRFMGVMTANYQAMNLFVCLLCGFTLAQKSARWFCRLSPFLLLFAALLILTRARIGSILFLGAATFVLLRLGRQWLRPQARAAALLAVLAIGVPVVTFALGSSGEGALSSLFMMGRHDTESTASLSNRAPLWAELLDSVAERPILGCGFDSFWNAERVQKISVDQGWVVPHAHNTYLDQTLTLGVVGCLLYGGMVLSACAVAWRRYRRHPSGDTLMPALLLSWLVLLGTTESIPIAPYLPSLIAYSCVVRMCLPDRAAHGRAGRLDDIQTMPWSRGPYNRALSPNQEEMGGMS